MSKKEGKKSKKILIIVSIIILAVIILGCVMGSQIIQEGALISEINDLVENVDLTTDTIDVNDIKTSGDYAKVETAVKTYLSDCAVEFKEMMAIINDEKLTNVLTVENYKNDGKEFNESLAYIDETINKLENISNKIDILMNKEEIMKYIQEYNLSESYNQLFEKLMFDEDTEKELQEAQTQIQLATIELKNTLEVEKETLKFLKQNKSNWTIENDTIVFYSQSLINQYNALIQKL